MKEGADFAGVSHYTHVDVQPGGINIQNVEHLYQADILKQLGIELEVKSKGEALDEKEVKQNENQNERSATQGDACQSKNQNKEELFHFIHPSMDEEQERKIHNEVKRLVKRQGIQMICQHLAHMQGEGKLLLPPNPSVVYKQLVRLGMPTGEGYSEKYFKNYFNQ